MYSYLGAPPKCDNLRRFCTGALAVHVSVNEKDVTASNEIFTHTRLPLKYTKTCHTSSNVIKV